MIAAHCPRIQKLNLTRYLYDFTIFFHNWAVFFSSSDLSLSIRRAMPYMMPLEEVIRSLSLRVELVLSGVDFMTRPAPLGSSPC